MFRILLAALFALPFLQAGLNRETGAPAFQYYSQDQYQASGQNWAIAQDHRGVMYFGNTDGVIEFDGQSWRTIRLDNVQSLAVDEGGVVYAGGIGDFGLLRPDPTGTMKFVSLLGKVPLPDRKIQNVWRILPTPAGVYFSTYERLFRLNKDGSVKVWRPESHFGRAVYVLNALYVKTQEQGLLRMEGDKLSAVSGGGLFKTIGVTDAVSRAKDALIATPGGLFLLSTTGEVKPFPTGADSWFAKNLLYTIRVMPDGEIAAGTRKGGLALLDPSGALDRIVSDSDGLPGDFVTSIFVDGQGGLWVTGMNGLTRFHAGLSLFGKKTGLEGDVFCMSRQGGSMYIGTTVGLFRMQTEAGLPPHFDSVAGINTGVLTLLPRGDELLAATSVGVFKVSGIAAVPLFQSAHPQPVFDVSLSLRDKDTIYAAGREGVFRLHLAGKTWLKSGQYTPPGEEFRTVLEDADGTVWATTRGAIWRIDFSGPGSGVKFGADQGVPVVPGGWINAHRLQGHVTFATSKGLRMYSGGVAGRFDPDKSLGEQFADDKRDVFNIFDDPGGNVWITGEQYHGVLLKQNGGGYKWFPMPLEHAGIKEIYGMSFDQDGTVWANGTKLILYRWERALAGDPDRNFNALTRLVRTNQNDILYGGAGAFPDSMQLPWHDNNLHFDFVAPFYEDPGAVEYQYFLEGSDREWSPWSHQTSREYSYLPPDGAYEFHVRARTPHGTVNEQSALIFGVLPPWYRTWWAYSIYAVLLAIGVWGIVRWRTRQLEEDKRQLEVIVEERTVEIRQQRDEIHVQERKSQSLLLNILPAAVADELKATGAVQPVGFDEVTVCFTDFVGFTLSSEKMAPAMLVDALNEYFTAFDEIIARYGLEKLKTIGDSYMFASGLPEKRASHAVNAVLAALEMAEVVKRLALRPDGTGWNIRIGLHSGPVIAGVVGIRKFAFDIWGNTVNFAARMESSGVHGRVNISERTCLLTRGLIDCEARGHIRIKEGRELPMFLAHGPAPDFAARYRAEFGEELRTAPESLTALVGQA